MKAPHGRVMALDVGARRIGVALSDPLQVVARPLLTIVRGRRVDDMGLIGQLIDEWQVKRLVVGWPLLPSGDRGDQARIVERFIDRLRPLLSVPIEVWDESYTTAVAAERRRARGRSSRQPGHGIDAEAAAVILEEWLQARRPETAGGEGRRYAGERPRSGSGAGDGGSADVER